MIFYHIVSLFCSLLIFPLCMTRCGSTDGSLLNEHTRINKTNMSAAREWTDYLMAIFYSRLLIPVGNIKVILLTLLHKEALHSRMWGKLSFHLANSSCVDNQSELFWTISLDIKVFPQLLESSFWFVFTWPLQSMI